MAKKNPEALVIPLSESTPENPQNSPHKFDAAETIKAMTGQMAEEWFQRGLKCREVFFHQPVPQGKDKTPANEFRICEHWNEKGELMRTEKGRNRLLPVSPSDQKYYVEGI